ncbi:MAG: hypothetical protein HAW67_04890 [Endozoicomonadaceae bacterium]|nr:hypothetical protein [Endozoicomonadaceae bacterium]
MAVFWGSTWCQIINSDFNQNGIKLFSKYPTPDYKQDKLGNEQTELFIDKKDGYTYVPHDDKKSAEYAVKMHLFASTEDVISEKTVTLIVMELEIEKGRYEIKHGKLDEERKKQRQLALDSSAKNAEILKQEIKDLRQIRRMKVNEF